MSMEVEVGSKVRVVTLAGGTYAPRGTVGTVDIEVDDGVVVTLENGRKHWFASDEIEAIPTSPVPEFSSDEWYTIMQALCLMEISEAFTIGPDLADRIGAYLDGLTDDE